MSTHRRIDRSQSSYTLSQTCKSRSLVDTHKLDEEFVRNLEEVEQRLEQFSKHERIRIEGWMKKLCQVISNPVWKQNRNFYIQLLLEMLRYKMVCAPFTHLPPDGPLPRLSKTDIILPWQKLPLSASKSTVLSTNSDICNIAWQLPLHHKQMSCTQSESLAKNAFLKSCSQEQLNSLRYQALAVGGGSDTENLDPRKLTIPQNDLRQSFVKSQDLNVPIECLPPIAESMAFIATQESEGDCKSSSVNVREIVSLKQRLEECEQQVRRVLAEKEQCQQQLQQFQEIASLNTQRQEEEQLNSQQLVDFVQRSVKLVYQNYDRLYGQIESIFLVKQAQNLAQKMNFELPIDYLSQQNKQQKSQSEQIEQHFKYHSRELHDKFNKTAEETQQFKNFLENVQQNVNQCRENSNKSQNALQQPPIQISTQIKRPSHLRLIK